MAVEVYTDSDGLLLAEPKAPNRRKHRGGMNRGYSVPQEQNPEVLRAKRAKKQRGADYRLNRQLNDALGRGWRKDIDPLYVDAIVKAARDLYRGR